MAVLMNLHQPSVIEKRWLDPPPPITHDLLLQHLTDHRVLPLNLQFSKSSTHTLRSNFHYSHADVFVPRRPNLLKAFNDAYRPFKEGQKIPEDALARLEEFTIDEHTFLTLTKRELEKGRYIYLEDGKVEFDTYTMPHHAEVIINLAKQIESQNNNPELFLGGTAGDVTLQGSCKQSDAH